MARGKPHGKTANAQRDAAHALAIQALSFLASEPEHLGRFLATSGIGPDDIRTAARDPQFLNGVLDHMAGDEALLIAFAQHEGIDPTEVERARAALGGVWERDTP